MKAKSIKGKSPEEIQSALDQSLANGFNPTLAIVFISIKQDRKSVCELLTAKGMDIYGATSSGEFIDGHESDGGISVLLLDLDRGSYNLYYSEVKNDSIREGAEQLAKTAYQKFSNPAVIFCTTGINSDGEFFDGNAWVQKLEIALGKDKMFFGGMAGADLQLHSTVVFTDNRETYEGIVALILNADQIDLNGMAITGWKKMGIARKVTKSQGNFLYAIDGKPAVDMYLKYLGLEGQSNTKEFNIMDELSYFYPFITKRDETGEVLIKSPMKIDRDENALVMEMEMREGDEFWFSVPPDFNIVEEILEEATEVKNQKQDDADALIVFSCAGRRPVLGPLVTSENEGLAEVWNCPMAGFYTYGEYGRSKNGKQNFHSAACCWVAIREKSTM